MVTIYPIYFANTSSFLQNREKDGKIETNKKGVITMKFVIQRVLESAVKVDGETIGEIGKGLVVLIGVGREDTKEIADKMVKKLVGMRIFEDENGKTNLSLADVDGSLLLISQFTLYANCKKGNRPSFIEAGDPKEARSFTSNIIEPVSPHSSGGKGRIRR